MLFTEPIRQLFDVITIASSVVVCTVKKVAISNDVNTPKCTAVFIVFSGIIVAINHIAK